MSICKKLKGIKKNIFCNLSFAISLRPPPYTYQLSLKRPGRTMDLNVCGVICRHHKQYRIWWKFHEIRPTIQPDRIVCRVLCDVTNDLATCPFLLYTPCHGKRGVFVCFFFLLCSSDSNTWTSSGFQLWKLCASIKQSNRKPRECLSSI